MLRWHHTRVAHHLSRLFKATKRAEFGRQRDCGDLSDAAQRLKRIDQRAQLLGRIFDRAVDGGVPISELIG